MSDSVRIVGLTPENYPELGCPCFLNPKHAAHLTKLKWLSERFPEGFTIKLLFTESEKKPAGFIEYTHGEYAWRAVDAADYLFIHCIWVNPNKCKKKGYGSLLVAECLKDAKKAGKHGVAVVTSDGPFMANKALFLKNGFELVETSGRFELLVKKLKNGSLPKFKEWQKQLSQYTGLNLIYSNQCPWVARAVSELSDVAKEKALELKITELKTAAEAQNAPSVYATYSLVLDGRLLVDHYISTTRFLNIMRKELGTN